MGAQCSRFDAAKFAALTQVYAALMAVCPMEDTADVKALDVKLQECFATAIDRETDGALVIESTQGAVRHQTGEADRPTHQLPRRMTGLGR